MKALQIFLGAIYVVLIVLLLLFNCEGPARPETFEAKIQVVDADNGQPIKGAKVRITSDDNSCNGRTLTTNRKGECTFTYTLPDAEFNATASKAGYNTTETDTQELNYFDDGDVLVIPLEKTEIEEDARDIGQMGKLKVTLQWTDRTVDLDVHVIEPNGFEIFFNEDYDPRTGGKLDIDWTPQKEECRNRPCAENIFWRNPPRGDYAVKIVYYAEEDVNYGPEATCRVTIFKGDEQPQVFDDVLLKAPHEVVDITTVHIE